MEILRSNFSQCLPIVSEAIEEASFLAVDAEFSGLNSHWKQQNALDSPQERYTKLKNTSHDFIIVQFGLCAFIWNENLNKYIAKPFNFYIFPRQIHRSTPDVRFLCQSSSLDFLSGHNFDFQKWITQGISYLRPYDEQKLRDNFQERQAEHSFGPFTSPPVHSPTGSSTKNVYKTPVIVPPEHQEFVSGACSKIEEMVKDPDGKRTSLPPCNGYLRKLIYQTVKHRFRSGIHLEKNMNEKKECFIVATKVDDNEKKTFEEEKMAKEDELIESAVGFSAVMKMISDSGKLVVGHNMLLDLLHIVDQFFCPLPADLDDFKATVQSLLPRVLDTKVMATTQPFKNHLPSTVLGDLVKHLTVSPFRRPEVFTDQQFSLYEEGSENLHEAAYDAYITGLSFVSMANYLGSFQDPPKVHISPDSALVTPFINKIFMMRMEDIPYLNLAGPDLKPARDHVFFLTFPSSWKYVDILDLFSPFGFVYVSWLNDVSAYVSLAVRNKSKAVLDALDVYDAPYTITSYAEYHGDVMSRSNEIHDDGQTSPQGVVQGVKRQHTSEKEDNADEEGEKKSKTRLSTQELEDGEIDEPEEPVAKKKKVFEEPEDW
ncbi:poly(A)-specific ribonuclease PARN [Nematostella vectensis]|uniref:poly(A)-specific ribonuclease PARN n=1 Tax=Nematostella vectensis TaxID=45351 RepID=UPI0020779ABF|nr:poly(A)-specific ribonuclease PARN [Nematostella vectensis]